MLRTLSAFMTTLPTPCSIAQNTRCSRLKRSSPNPTRVSCFVTLRTECCEWSRCRPRSTPRRLAPLQANRSQLKISGSWDPARSTGRRADSRAPLLMVDTDKYDAAPVLCRAQRRRAATFHRTDIVNQRHGQPIGLNMCNGIQTSLVRSHGYVSTWGRANSTRATSDSSRPCPSRSGAIAKPPTN